jgi:hypothetical protein
MFYVTGNRFGHVPNTDNYWNFNLQSILASEIYVCVHSHMFQYFFYKPNKESTTLILKLSLPPPLFRHCHGALADTLFFLL